MDCVDIISVAWLNGRLETAKSGHSSSVRCRGERELALL